MGRRILPVIALAITLPSCASLTPPPPEAEIRLKDALLDTTASLAAMKADLGSRGHRLNMYADDITVEFYVKGSRQAIAKTEAELALVPPGFAKTLVIKPSYTATADGERQNKITIKFKSLAALTPEQRQYAEACLVSDNCITIQNQQPKKATE